MPREDICNPEHTTDSKLRVVGYGQGVLWEMGGRSNDQNMKKDGNRFWSQTGGGSFQAPLEMLLQIGFSLRPTPLSSPYYSWSQETTDAPVAFLTWMSLKRRQRLLAT